MLSEKAYQYILPSDILGLTWATITLGHGPKDRDDRRHGKLKCHNTVSCNRHIKAASRVPVKREIISVFDVFDI